MEPGKGQLGLGLHPGGAQHPGLGRGGRIGRRVQQHRLASARLTTEQQCRVIGRPIKECADQRALTATSEQNRRFFKSFQRGQPISEAGPPSMRVRRPHLRRDTSGCLPRGIPRARTYPAGPAPRTPATLPVLTKDPGRERQSAASAAARGHRTRGLHCGPGGPRSSDGAQRHPVRHDGRVAEAPPRARADQRPLLGHLRQLAPALLPAWASRRAEVLFRRRQCSGESWLPPPEKLTHVGAVLPRPLGFRRWHLAHRCPRRPWPGVGPTAVTGVTAPAIRSSSPPSSNTMTPLHSRLQPWPG